MDEKLIRRITNIAGQGAQALKDAHDCLEGMKQGGRDALDVLVALAAEINSRQGQTLAGHQFSFDGPDAKPTHEPLTNKFVARLFEARFEGSPVVRSSFGLKFEMDSHSRVTTRHLGGAKPYDPDTQLGVVDHFVRWLQDMRMHYPTQEG